jgi:hypothetical protein
VCQPLVRRREARLGFDAIKDRDTLNRLLGDGRLFAVPDIEELASAVRPARDLGDRPVRAKIRGAPIVERLEAGIAIGLQEAAEAGEMPRRVLATAIRTVEVRICGEIKESYIAEERRNRISKALGATRGSEVTLGM